MSNDEFSMEFCVNYDTDFLNNCVFGSHRLAFKSQQAHTSEVNVKDCLNRYISALKVNGNSKYWQRTVEKWLWEFVDSVNAYDAIEVTTYVGLLRERLHPASYSKRFFQIRRFLHFIKQDSLDFVKLKKIQPAKPRIVASDDVKNLLKYFYEKDKKHFTRTKAFILTIAYSGIRTKEAFQLTLNDIDLLNNKIYIRCDKEHTQKTGQERVVFITETTKNALLKHIKRNGNKRLFNESTLTRLFIGSPLRIKMLRKYFSQEATRRNMNQIAKEMLMGHSLKNNVDAMHYCTLTELELKKIYNETFKD